MTGVAAVAMCAAFTSCSKNEDLYDPGAVREMEIANVYEQFNQAFIKTFGQVHPNQDWGFGPKVGTRTWNVNGNQWHDPNYYNLEQDPPVTTAEKNMVFNYVNNPTQVQTVNQISFTKYWVSQIWNGNKDENPDKVKAPVSHSYPNQNGSITDIIGGAQMDKLEIKENASTWTHCNNFNHADNNDWKEEGEGGRTLMVESGTLSFRYTNSQSSYLSEKYIIVPGANIHPSLANFYYVCFDFEKGYTDAEKEQETTYFSYKAVDNNGAEQAEQTVSLPGYYTSTNMPTNQQILDAVSNPNYKSISSISIKGYLYGDKHCDGDGNYTDWIVRISPAEVKQTSDYDVRIMAEDLNATAVEGDIENSDWDYNDVVFDVKFTSDGGADITLVAAGGVLPLEVADVEVHEKLGYSKDPKTGWYPMINTNAANGKTANHQTFHISNVNASLYGKDISIVVYKKLSEDSEPIPFQLTGEKGKPAAKFAVQPGTPYCNERVHIDAASNGAFSRGVENGGRIYWGGPVE